MSLYLADKDFELAIRPYHNTSNIISNPGIHESTIKSDEMLLSSCIAYDFGNVCNQQVRDVRIDLDLHKIADVH